MDANSKAAGIKEAGSSIEQLILDKISDKTKLFQERMNEFLDQEVTTMIDQCRSELKGQNNNKNENKEKLKIRNGEHHLKDKEFVVRNSLLTDMYNINHISSIYYIFIAILSVMAINTIFCEYHGLIKPIHNFAYLTWLFGKLDVVLMVVLGMEFVTFTLFYNSFVFWANHRHYYGKAWDYFWLFSYLLYLAAFFYYPARSISVYEVPIASSTIILAEQVRTIMKNHAFVRYNAERIIYTPKTEDQTKNIPVFSKFIYHYFAPTIIYKDEYPRTAKIRWHIVIQNLIELVAVTYFTFILFTNISRKFENFGKEPINIPKYVNALLSSTFPSAMIMINVHYSLLHCWQNAMAELLRFGDRQFYTDWWNCKNYSAYYRTWNIVIHDYLYTYIFKDIYKIFSSRFFAAMSVFIISAIIHEYILATILGFFFPVLLILFLCVGVPITFLPRLNFKGSENVLFWTSFISGQGIDTCMYLMEWYARKNCPSPPNSDSTFDFLIPRMWVCYTNSSV